MYEANGKRDLARKHYEQALAIDPRLGWAANNLAWMHASDGGDLDVALSLAQKAKEQLPDSPIVSDTLGWILYKKGMHAAALPVLQECVKQVPSSATYRYHLGMALLAGGKKKEASVSLEAARRLKLTPKEDQEAVAALASLK